MKLQGPKKVVHLHLRCHNLFHYPNIIGHSHQRYLKGMQQCCCLIFCSRWVVSVKEVGSRPPPPPPILYVLANIELNGHFWPCYLMLKKMSKIQVLSQIECQLLPMSNIKISPLVTQDAMSLTMLANNSYVNAHNNQESVTLTYH